MPWSCDVMEVASSRTLIDQIPVVSIGRFDVNNHVIVRTGVANRLSKPELRSIQVGIAKLQVDYITFDLIHFFHSSFSGYKVETDS